jgi:hypothetical protein
MQGLKEKRGIKEPGKEGSKGGANDKSFGKKEHKHGKHGGEKDKSAEKMQGLKEKRGIKEPGKEGPKGGAKETPDTAAKKAKELPGAMAQAKAITKANDAANTPAPALIGVLNASVKSKYSWLKRFEARPKAVPGHYSIHMIASEHQVDPDYSVRVGPSGKRWDDPTMTEDEFIRDYKDRYPKTSLSDDELKHYFKDGKRLKPETGRLAEPIRPIEPTGTRDLPTEGPGFEAWNGYRRGDKSKLPCFPAGTLVKTLLGDRVIEEIAESDMVFAHDFESHCLVVRPVTAVYKNWTQHIVVVDTDRGKLSSTRSHPYWVESEDGWLPAVKLRKGMMLGNSSFRRNICC